MMVLTPANIGTVTGFGGLGSDLSGLASGLGFNTYGASHSSSRTNRNTSSPKPHAERHSMECSSRPKLDQVPTRQSRHADTSEVHESYKSLPCGLTLPQRAYDHYTTTSDTRRVELPPQEEQAGSRARSSSIRSATGKRRKGKEYKRHGATTKKGSTRTSMESSRSKRSAKPVPPQVPRVPMIDEEETAHSHKSKAKWVCFT